jgi:hypothetical protein
VDYAFAPGTDPDIKRLQQLLRDRVKSASGLDTKLIEMAGVTTVTDFLRDVDTTEPLPTGDLILGSHGNDTGWLEIDMDALAPSAVSYQVLTDIWNDVSRRNRLRIPPDMYTTAQNQREPVRVLIKGCRVGQAPKFVDGLTMVFGGKIPVIAPKHFFGVRQISKTRGKKLAPTVLGSFEHLSYSNEVVAPTAMKRADLLAAFRAKGFQQYDATSTTPSPIPDLWDTWLPKTAKNLGLGKRPISYTVSLGRTLEKHKTLTDMGQFRHLVPRITYRIANPPASVKTRAGFKTSIAARPEFQPGWGPTGFPVYEQWGHATFDEFFDSFVWTPPPAKKFNSDPFIWVGTRHEYNILLPVVEPPMTGKAADRLIYNYFPPRGGSGSAFIELLESEAGLFYLSPGAP